MSAVATFFGWFCMAMLAFGAACVALICAAESVRALLNRHKSAAKLEQRGDIGRSLISSAHWFSEDPYAHMVVRVLGERIRDGYSIDDTNAWRNEARSRTKAKP